MAALSFYSLFLSLLLTLSSAGKNGHRSATHHRTTHHPLNPKLHQAYLALHAWKKSIFSDPRNFTSNWSGPTVCNYTGIYCTTSPNDPHTAVVAGIDLNHGRIAGFLPDELGLLTDLALLHLNSNRFCGVLPKTLANLSLLFELDISNNRFVGPFPSVVLSLPSLHYLDIRFNEFEGPIPYEVFYRGLDAIFVNNNWFTNVVLPNISTGGTQNASASVIVLANNNLSGCLSPRIADFAATLEEFLLINTSLSGCLPPEVGFLYKLRVLDVSFNNIEGPIPYTLTGLTHLEQLNLGHNLMTGIVPSAICSLPSLKNFTYSYNYFCEEEGVCSNRTTISKATVVFDDRRNCLPEKPLQRSKEECQAMEDHPIDCFQHCCEGGTSFLGLLKDTTDPFASSMVPSLISPSPSPFSYP